MTVKKEVYHHLDELKSGLRKSRPMLFMGSGTSTVIPYHSDEFNQHSEVVLADLSQLPIKLESQEMAVRLSGAVSWRELREFTSLDNKEVLTWPTEELALVLSGLATSATGERCFGYGTLRDQVLSLKYLDSSGVEHQLDSQKKLIDHSIFSSQRAQELLSSYQKSYQVYAGFKNAPFPRLERETDLMIGFEGQLGVITEATLKVQTLAPLTYLLIECPSWIDDDSLHLKIFEAVQDLREKVSACEFLDSQSLSFLPKETWNHTHKDLIYLEVKVNELEEIYEAMMVKIPDLNENNLFQVDETKIRNLRMAVPRMVADLNSRNKMTKLGTDIQVGKKDFSNLLSEYRSLALKGVQFVLFGHFGDAHLHFNYLATQEQRENCLNDFEKLYERVRAWSASPFAEHGIGLLKQKYIKKFHTEVQLEMFRYLKNELDPNEIFFPNGFMSGARH